MEKKAGRKQKGAVHTTVHREEDGRASLRQVDPQEQVAGAHLDKPAGVAHPAAEQSSGITQSEAKQKVKRSVIAIVSKGAERIPVQLKDEAHLAQLQAEHGAANVEIQS